MRERPLIVLGIAACCLAACGGGDDTGTTAGTIVAAPSTPAEKIASMEQTGTLPVLDRSTELRGPDTDHDGIRDDIDRWIASLALPASQQKAALQMAVALQQAMLVDVADQAATRLARTATSHAVKCLVASSPTGQDASKLMADIRKYTANTRPRITAYFKYAIALDGSVTMIPEGDGCVR